MIVGLNELVVGRSKSDYMTALVNTGLILNKCVLGLYKSIE